MAKSLPAQPHRALAGWGPAAPAPAPSPAPASGAGALPALFAKALKRHRAGRLAEAAAQYERILALKPDLPEVHNNLGVALAGLGRLEAALAAYRQSIAHDPRFARAYGNLGNALRQLGRSEEAAAAFRAVITLDPDNALAHASLGNVLKSLGRLDEAQANYDRAIALDPEFADAHYARGNLLMDLNRPGDAEASFLRVIALKPDFPGAYNNLGLALKEVGRLDEARLAAEHAIRLSPRTGPYYGNLAEVRSFVAGDAHILALEALLGDATLANADRVHVHFALAKAYDDIGRCEDAFRQLLAGGALKRRQNGYDEDATLAGLARVQQVFTPELITLHRGAGDPSPVPVFIVGMPRSGTTLIEQILASHPRVFGAGELNLFDRAAAGVRNALPGSPPFPELASSMSGNHLRVLGTLYRTELMKLAPAAMRITDKMTSNFMFAGLIHLALPNAAIIHAVRDPVDTCLSCFFKHFKEGQKHTYDLAELGRHYRHYQALMAHWRRVLPPGRILDVRYENVVDDLERSARSIIAHCGLDWDPRCLDFHLTQRTVRTASAAQVRRPIYRSSVGRRRAYAAFLGPLLAALEPAPA